MILLFGQKSAKTNKNSNIKNLPVENSGILAMNRFNNPISLLSANEYDMYMFSKSAEIDYSLYSDYSEFNADNYSFMSDFSNAVATLGDCSSFDCGGFSDCSASSSCSAFSSVC